MTKIMKSFSVIAFVAAVAIAGTGAFFSDTETSTGNVFTAGAIDLKIDNEQHYNGMVCTITDAGAGYTWQPDASGVVPTGYPVEGSTCDGTWELTDLGIEHQLFDFEDIKPGDGGEDTISLHVINNDAWACVSIIPTMNDDVSSTEPELKAAGETENTDSIFDGELAQNLEFMIWADMCNDDKYITNADYPVIPGDNIYQAGCDLLLTEGNGPIVPTTYALATPTTPNVFTGVVGQAIDGTMTNYLGVAWSLPTTAGNIVQTDTYHADVSFYVEQSRSNDDFTCGAVDVAPTPNTLRLENETEVSGAPWIVTDDDIYADLTWQGNGPTFDYTLTGQGLAYNTDYSLIYYADGWPGNNPGAFIGSATSSATGIINMNGNPNLNMDLPMPADGNYAVGAKIWLVLTADYNAGTSSMIGWNPTEYLFEGNVYINYDDTDFVPTP